MIRHWDDDPWTVLEHGDLQCERQRLCSTTGAPRAALSRYTLVAGPDEPLEVLAFSSGSPTGLTT